MKWRRPGTTWGSGRGCRREQRRRSSCHEVGGRRGVRACVYKYVCVYPHPRTNTYTHARVYMYLCMCVNRYSTGNVVMWTRRCATRIQVYRARCIASMHKERTPFEGHVECLSCSLTKNPFPLSSAGSRDGQGGKQRLVCHGTQEEVSQWGLGAWSFSKKILRYVLQCVCVCVCV